jgi:hypothetical protein
VEQQDCITATTALSTKKAAGQRAAARCSDAPLLVNNSPSRRSAHTFNSAAAHVRESLGRACGVVKRRGIDDPLASGRCLADRRARAEVYGNRIGAAAPGGAGLGEAEDPHPLTDPHPETSERPDDVGLLRRARGHNLFGGFDAQGFCLQGAMGKIGPAGGPTLTPRQLVIPEQRFEHLHADRLEEVDVEANLPASADSVLVHVRGHRREQNSACAGQLA